MQFKDIIGQQDIKEQLINTVRNNRISHAMLFHGKGCVGKLPLAMAMAQYIHCENPGENDSCGVCPACKKHAHLGHPDLHYVFPVINDKSRKTVSDSFIEEWRSMIKESPYFTLSQWIDLIKTKGSSGQGMIYAEESQEIIKKLSLKTYESEYKIIIIAFADKMNISASNKLLKILEEPTDKTLFILTVEEAGVILPTIYSRCQPLHVKPLDKNDLFDALMKTAEYQSAEVSSAVNISQGCYCRAVSHLESSDENSEKLDAFIKIMRSTYAGSVRDMIDLAESVSKKHVDEQKQTLYYISSQLRNNFIKTIKANSLAALSESENEFSEKFHPFINEKNIFQFREEIEKALLHLERNGNAQIIFLDLFLTFHRLFKLVKN